MARNSGDQTGAKRSGRWLYSVSFFLLCESTHKNEICMRRRVEVYVAIWCLLRIFMPKGCYKRTKISINENLTIGIRIANKPERASCDLTKWKMDKSRKKSVGFLWLAPNNIEMHTPHHSSCTLSPSSWLKIFPHTDCHIYLFLFYFFRVLCA